MEKFVGYARVSTDKQGQSGLGMEAQQAAVCGYVERVKGGLIAPMFTDVMSGRRRRKNLDAALGLCRREGATLVIARLDRLSRNAAFLIALRDGDVKFVAVDMPDADRLLIGIMALVAEKEAETISARTKAALAAAKRRGVRMGNRKNPREAGALGGKAWRETAAAARAGAEPRARELRKRGLHLREIASVLNGEELRTARGGRWSFVTVHRLLNA